ncbi:hypothetical protein PTTG_30362, partial [Puccinia triticina 1-1 BBBD Race 1]
MTEHDRNVVVLSTLRAVLSRLDSLTRSPAALNGPQAPAAADVPLAEQIRRFLFLPADKELMRVAAREAMMVPNLNAYANENRERSLFRMVMTHNLTFFPYCRWHRLICQ